MRTEYHMWTLNGDEIVEICNKVAKDGWEVVSLTAISSNAVTNLYKMLTRKTMTENEYHQYAHHGEFKCDAIE